MHSEPKDISFYVPIHSNFSQVESTLPFLSQYGGKVFIYSWNQAESKMRKFYQQFTNVKVVTFSKENLINELKEEKRKVVFLTTASLSYLFGTAQLEFLRTLFEF